MEWISVKDKLPEVHLATDGEYVYYKDKRLWIYFADTGTWDEKGAQKWSNRNFAR